MSEKNPLADDLVARVHAADERLRKHSFYGRLMRGDVDGEEYAAWLVQLHKYVRHTVRGERGLAEAMSSRASWHPGAAKIASMARRAVEEESGHDDLLLEDLARLWGVSPDEALGRVERTAPAPSVQAWASIVDTMLARFPAGVIGVALALETIATLQLDEMRRSLVERAEIPGIASAVSFIGAHSAEVEDGHAMAGRARAAALVSPEERSSVFFYGNAALALFEGIAHYLGERFSKTRELAIVGRTS
jgi:hypothetical protein